MMKLLFVALFAAAACLALWRTLKPERKRRVMLLTSRAAVKVRDAARAIQERAQRKRTAYRQAFLTDRGELSPQGEIMLAHLTAFCYAFSTTAANKATRDEMLRREGRRQVWIEIMGQIGREPPEALIAAQNQVLG